MRKLIFVLLGLIALAACKNQPEPAKAGYVVQVSLGGWHSPDYTAEQIIGRIDTVAALIPVEKVIIGWSVEPELYRTVGEHLHAKGIDMLLWLPVFAETEEVCDNVPAVDLAGNIPANYDLAAGEGFRNSEAGWYVELALLRPTPDGNPVNVVYDVASDAALTVTGSTEDAPAAGDYPNAVLEIGMARDDAGELVTEALSIPIHLVVE